jgi:type I restriction enzyme S subunit
MKAVNPESSREWPFGPIPQDWSALPLKYLCTRTSLYGANIPADAYEDTGVRFLRTTDIRDDGTLDGEGVFVAAELVNDYMLADGDFLISRSGTVGRACVYRARYGPCAYAGYLVRYVLRYPDTPRWLFYITKSPGFQQWLGASAIEATIGNVNGEKYANLVLPVPPLPEQRGIADYLDRETARLDALVAAKERVLRLLAEKRRALITRAVTRGLPSKAAAKAGLDPHAPLRESGIPWLGEIPAYWAAKRLKFISPEITVGIVVTPAKYYESAGVPCLRSLNVREEGLTDSELVYISDESNALLEKSQVFSGDLVAVRSGQPGTTAVVDGRFDGANCIDLIIIRRSHACVAAFLAHFLNSQPAKMQFLSGSGGAIQQHFNIETAKDLVAPVPPLEEQRAIVAHIATETAKLDAMRAATERTIALLKERRAALIAAAVTGKIDVGAVAA